MSEIVFARRTNNRIYESSKPEQVFRAWKGAEECWLFISPHDDDIVLGTGLHFIAAIESGVKVHAIVSTIGAGYCRIEDKHTIAQIRRTECRRSFELLGLPPQNLHFYDYWANDILRHLGRRFVGPNDSGIIHPYTQTTIMDADGLQNSFTWSLRHIRPTRIFLPSQTDIHPAHRAVREELIISVFHSRGAIWPELGEPLAAFPRLYEYATYNDYAEPPNHQVRTSRALFDRKLAGIAAYESQKQIEVLVENIRNQGPREYVREMEFKLYDPQQYDKLFEQEEGAV
ncbi:MAG: PIG-L family deacetylase [Planctomycetaceae bacterium]|jgi:LmbE family N-acetylglucosaminyl deacetylase|nr:PIG-L family deacetylase [Planctomycetaceae bacterium]